MKVTVYLVLAYLGPEETCNCHEKKYHDWHLEIYDQSLDHAPKTRDSTGIVCGVIPYSELTVYNSGVKLRKLTAFTREGRRTVFTGHPAHKIRVTGCVLWDNAHNRESEIGPQILGKDARGYYQPWRQTPWEIHPVFAIEDLGTK